ncbi:PhzF family phenazine biosynthesis protein [Deinococcus koreensis]|uniref:Phenazine biosynthesis PhzC/PhzF protein n=1 Tax=Deinococcus koreensis TaxID=2054903 RepID=A0A2K3V0T5_9DEIO|nr:PhzF family phenazine biosynthesis protein [Deinococcus koreensis]PNY82393.1 phenazine biosynthesis PhzC/PhzF protein [Deinococcus koreensis]
MSAEPVLYRVLAPSPGASGKLVALFRGASGDLQARALTAGAPLSVFIEQADTTAVHLRVFTLEKEKGSSDSAALAALTFLHARSPLFDVVDVTMGGETLPAQLCGGEWLLRQGEVRVQEVEGDLSPLGLSAARIWSAQTQRPNLVVEVADLTALETFSADADAISAVSRATGTTGLVVFCMGGPAREDVSFRAFGPLKGFVEDAASSNMGACLIGVLGHLGRLPADTNLLRAAQRMPGQPARLSVQFATLPGGVEVWVGGSAQPQPSGAQLPVTEPGGGDL